MKVCAKSIGNPSNSSEQTDRPTLVPVAISIAKNSCNENQTKKKFICITLTDMWSVA